jgi:tetratricopeptide (TPR) repeat protein
LSSVKVIAADGRILVREGDSSWEAETGQTVFDFAKARVAGPTSSVCATRKLVHADTAEYWFDRGLKFDRADAHDAAAACYRRAMSLDPSELNSRINLGRLLHDKGSLDAAETLYREALRIEPGNAVAAFNLGVALEDQGKLEGALASYGYAVLADPQLPDAHYNLARLYEFSGDTDSAARHLARFHALTREHGE